MILHIIDGGCFMAGMVFLDQFTIMTAFIGQITKNPLIISLIPAAVVVGYNTPGLFSAPLIQKVHNKHFFIIISGIFQRLMILLLALFTFSLPRFSPLSAGLISILIYFLFAGIGGFGGPAWLDLFTRTLPKGKRSRIVAIRNATGAAAGIVFPALIAFILKKYAFPRNYRALLFIAFGFIMLSWIAFLLIQDKEAPIVHKTNRIRFLPFLKSLPKNDPNFIRFLASRVLFSICIVGNSFYTLFYLAKNQSMDDSVIAAFAFVLNLSKIPSALLLGQIGDKRGNLLVYKIGIVCIIPANIVALLSPSLPMFLLVYLFLGFILSADINTYQSFIGEFGNERNRIYYISLGNFTAGIFSGLFPIAAGAMLAAHLFSMKSLFIFCAILSTFGLLLTHVFVKEPSLIQQTNNPV